MAAFLGEAASQKYAGTAGDGGPVRELRTPGSVRELLVNWQSYRDAA